MSALNRWGPTLPADLTDIMAGLICAFVVAQALAWVYIATFRGFSYSRNFVHALILSAITTTVVVAAIGNSLAIGIGVLGALAIIRFRTQIRDPRDIIFLFICLASGIACGAGAYTVAIAGGAVFSLVAFYLHLAPFSSLRTHQAVLRFAAAGDWSETACQDILDRCCSRTELSSMRETLTPGGYEYTYQIRLRDPAYHRLLVDELNAVPGIEDANLVLHRASVEL